MAHPQDPASLNVLYEDNHLLVVNKPAGMLAQGDQTGDAPIADMAARYLKEKYNKPGAVFVGVVHRLDRPVSGVVVLARTSKALSRMNRLFGLRETTKTYLALTARRPDADEARRQGSSKLKPANLEITTVQLPVLKGTPVLK